MDQICECEGGCGYVTLDGDGRSGRLLQPRKQALVVEALELLRRVGNLRRAGAQALGKELWRCMMLSVHSELDAFVNQGP
jgi:hypothetical protein